MVGETSPQLAWRQAGLLGPAPEVVHIGCGLAQLGTVELLIETKSLHHVLAQHNQNASGKAWKCVVLFHFTSLCFCLCLTRRLFPPAVSYRLKSKLKKTLILSSCGVKIISDSKVSVILFSCGMAVVTLANWNASPLSVFLFFSDTDQIQCQPNKLASIAMGLT